jgi:hypothetical protein
MAARGNASRRHARQTPHRSKVEVRMVDLLLPRRARGRPSPAAEATYQERRQAFCARILEIQSTMDFAIGVRGWCYVLEGHGYITKGDFSDCEKFVTDCRKTGDLPLDICAEDDSRATVGLQDDPHESDPRDHAQGWIDYLRESVADHYRPFNFWDDQKVYVEVAVEKLDLRNLFETVCVEFYVPIKNLKGRSDINARAEMMRRFAEHEAAGHQCVLLLANDHDPGGLLISDTMRKNLADLSAAVGWSPDNLIIERFGLNADFIEANRLVWIDNLETSSGARLDDPRHPNHDKRYVRDYIAEFGVRKCEANALVVAPEMGRQLCRGAILRYVDADAPRRYQRRLERARRELRRIINELLP